MKLIKNFSYNLFYQVLNLFLPLITIPIISRALGVEAIGLYSFSNATTQYFILFGLLGIQTYGAKQIAYVNDDYFKIRETFWSIYSLQLMFSSLSFVLYFCSSLYIFKEPIFFAQSIFVLSILFDISWLYTGLENFKKIVLRNTIVKIVGLLLIILFVREPSDLILYTMILSSTTLIGQISMWVSVKKIVGKPFISFKNAFNHLKPSLLLFLPQIAITIYTVLDKSMLGILSGYDQVGIYDQGQKIIRVILAIVPALSAVVMPRIAAFYSQGNHDEIKKLMNKTADFIWIMSFGSAFALIGIAPGFVEWFYGEDFASVLLVFYYSFPLIIAVGGANLISVQYLVPTNQHNKYTLSLVIAGVINFLFNLVLIPRIGFIGACVATVVAEYTGLAIQIFFVRKQLELNKLFMQVPKILFASILMFIIIISINLLMQWTIVTTIMQIVFGGLVYFLVLAVFKVIDLTKLKNNTILKR